MVFKTIVNSAGAGDLMPAPALFTIVLNTMSLPQISCVLTRTVLYLQLSGEASAQQEQKKYTRSRTDVCPGIPSHVVGVCEVWLHLWPLGTLASIR